jgi:hypothetical protein
MRVQLATTRRRFFFQHIARAVAELAALALAADETIARWNRCRFSEVDQA